MQTLIEVIKHRYFAFPMEQTDRDREIDSQFNKSDFLVRHAIIPLAVNFQIITHYLIGLFYVSFAMGKHINNQWNRSHYDKRASNQFVQFVRDLFVVHSYFFYTFFFEFCCIYRK